MRYGLSLFLVLLTAFAVFPALSEEAGAKAPASASPESEKDRVSYALGVQFGNSFADTSIELDLDMLKAGMADMLAGRELAVDQKEAQELLMALQQKLRAEQQAQMQEEGGENKAASDAFLAANAEKEGVKVLDSGLQYKVIEEGAGESPAETDKVKVHYRGTLLDGTEFDSSYKRGEPATFGVNQVIKGWTEALKMMKPGAKWQLWIPPDLAYGPQGRPGIPPSSLLTFEVELLEIVDSGEVLIQ
jgi:FKBP-type peptidyl-prolyl cis-trans isomerase